MSATDIHSNTVLSLVRIHFINFYVKNVLQLSFLACKIEPVQPLLEMILIFVSKGRK